MPEFFSLSKAIREIVANRADVHMTNDGVIVSPGIRKNLAYNAVVSRRIDYDLG